MYSLVYGNIVHLFDDNAQASARPAFKRSGASKPSVDFLTSKLTSLANQKDSPGTADKIRRLLDQMLVLDHDQALDQARLSVLKSDSGSAVEASAAGFMAEHAGRVLNLRDRVRYLQFAATHLHDPEQKNKCQFHVMGALQHALSRGPAEVVACIHACFQTIDSTDHDLKPVIDFALSEDFKSKALNPDNINEYGDYAALRDLAYNLLDKAQVQSDRDMMRRAEEFLGSCDLPSILAARADNPKP